MEWTRYQNPNGFSLEHPVGWTAETLPGPTVIVRGPDRQAMALIHPLRGVAMFSPAEIIERGLFTAAYLFPSAKSQGITPGPDNSVFGVLSYQTPSGAPGRAQLALKPQGDAGMLYAAAAPESCFAQFQPTLTRILQSLRQESATPSSVAPLASQEPPPARDYAPLSFTRFVDPQMGAFTLDVPQGWQVRGGLAHPMPGDRRPWIEAISPEGIYILYDPAFPQSFCHFPGQIEGQFAPLAAGGSFLNLKPSADRAADCYLKHIANRRFPSAQTLSRRPRPDLVELVKAGIRKMGIPIPRAAQTTAGQTLLQLRQAGQERIASLMAMAYFNGEYAMGMWAFWNATLYLSIAPPQLSTRAEEATMKMIASFQNTQRMFEIAQRDESIIYANSQAANMAQWNWFAGQQAAHNAQTAMGDAIVDNYWRQQQANDSLLRGWDQNQAVYDRLSQDRSDAMLDLQRLADDAQGKQYDVAAGSNHYWRNEQTGQIVGTNTNDPPDYSNSYKLLRKL